MLLLPHLLDAVVVEQQHTHAVCALVAVKAVDDLLQQHPSTSASDKPLTPI